jgi:hypothetical protein
MRVRGIISRTHISVNKYVCTKASHVDVRIKIQARLNARDEGCCGFVASDVEGGCMAAGNMTDCDVKRRGMGALSSPFHAPHTVTVLAFRR